MWNDLGHAQRLPMVNGLTVFVCILNINSMVLAQSFEPSRPFGRSWAFCRVSVDWVNICLAWVWQYTDYVGLSGRRRRNITSCIANVFTVSVKDIYGWGFLTIKLVTSTFFTQDSHSKIFKKLEGAKKKQSLESKTDCSIHRESNQNLR